MPEAELDASAPVPLNGGQSGSGAEVHTARSHVPIKVAKSPYSAGDCGYFVDASEHLIP